MDHYCAACLSCSCFCKVKFYSVLIYYQLLSSFSINPSLIWSFSVNHFLLWPYLAFLSASAASLLHWLLSVSVQPVCPVTLWPSFVKNTFILTNVWSEHRPSWIRTAASVGTRTGSDTPRSQAHSCRTSQTNLCSSVSTHLLCLCSSLFSSVCQRVARVHSTWLSTRSTSCCSPSAFDFKNL